MRTLEEGQSAFRAPWDRLLGAESHVRALRILDASDEPMSVRELARRARVHLRAMQVAVQKLEAGGVVERAGTGSHQQVQLRRTHPLVPALHSLFDAERARVDRVLDGLKKSAKGVRQAESVWLEGPFAEGVDDGHSTMVIGVLARSGEVDALVDALRSELSNLMRREDVAIEVRGWTRADLDATGAERVRALETSIPLLGAPPRPDAGDNTLTPDRRRSHAEVDANLLQRARRVAQALKQRPELITRARAEIEKRLATARPQEARTLREWQQQLEGLSPQRLRAWLVNPGEQATRLRQSMPITFLKAAETTPSERSK